ncbi:ArsR/SmtB family transcription factor [Desulforhopalus singaporensis]|uniref:Transcriptional regulator, ArsR family n=1 Tax=Desulforhopalus singaporensis TaxID=91360 RepID=A0A1H0L3Q2_9BACT|nr:metalloregulator ArsR/SmtB family transcription factor [Desulforhopalus singaporensis]SDO62666.1 transcriptional regulator, ArsR family [Desulforhopalus singaporensis]
MKSFIRVMKALSDPSRIKIIKMLQHKELCVCELTAALGLAQPTVSKHLKQLEDAGLVGFEKDGTWVNYRLAAESESPYAEVMLGQLREWLDDDKEIVELVLRLPSLDRQRITAA